MNRIEARVPGTYRFNARDKPPEWTGLGGCKTFGTDVIVVVDDNLEVTIKPVGSDAITIIM